MKCHYCGKEVWLVRHLLDGDFCSPAHRKKYHERLRRSLESLPGHEGPPGPVAGFRFEMPAADSSGLQALRYAGFQSTRPGPYGPRYSLELAPLVGQTFFGPNLAAGDAPRAVHVATVLDPILSAPKLGILQRGWNLAGGSIAALQQPLILGGVILHPGAAARPVYTAPEALALGVHPVICPSLTLGALFSDMPAGDTLADLRRAPLARPLKIRDWAALAIPRNNVRHPAVVDPQRLAAAAIATRNGSALRLVACAPDTFLQPLLAENTVAKGNLTPAPVETSVLERQSQMLLPATGNAARAQLCREDNAIWKIQPANPWNVAQNATAEWITAALPAAILPALAISPVRPGLAAEWETRSLAAGPLEITAAAVQGAQSALDPPERPAVPPAIAVAAVGVGIPQAVQPHSVTADVVSPQEQAASPLVMSELPIAAAISALAPRLQSSPPVAWKGLLVAGPVAPVLPAFIPQAAVPRYASELVAGNYKTETVVPAATSAGFARKTFAAVVPGSAERSLQPVVPEPQPVAAGRMALPDAAVTISGIGLPSLARELALDVYVQRVRVTARRESSWRELAIKVVPPAAISGVLPARFEQLVLQDWRRRYPARQLAVSPAPIGTGTNVVPITQRLSALARLQRNAPHFFKAAAAALVLGAAIWMGSSSKSVSSTVVADRHWVKQAISRRATLVLDDNFRSGLNLWDGRKNWSRSWSYSQDGFMRTGQLALYRPTLKMNNYRLEFFAQIENKSVGWVFRAKDEQNYYAMKLSVTEPGPRPLVSVVRYPVLGGKKGKKVQIPLPIMMHNNTPYRVALDVKGNRYRTFIEDQEVDSWHDDRLLAGGVGFFSETGEHARLYWVKVSKNTDWLGRLCGMLAGGERTRTRQVSGTPPIPKEPWRRWIGALFGKGLKMPIRREKYLCFPSQS